MRCPNGDHELQLPDRAWFNGDQYGTSSLVVAQCCNAPVTLTPVRSWQVDQYGGPRTEDDWGRPIVNRLREGRVQPIASS